MDKINKSHFYCFLSLLFFDLPAAASRSVLGFFTLSSWNFNLMRLSFSIVGSFADQIFSSQRGHYIVFLLSDLFLLCLLQRIYLIDYWKEHIFDDCSIQCRCFIEFHFVLVHQMGQIGLIIVSWIIENLLF